MFYGTGIEVDKRMREEEVNTEQYIGDEIDIKKLMTPFKPKGSTIKIKDFYLALDPKKENNLYSLISENLLVELISIFEDYIQNILKYLLHKNQELALSSDKQINADEILKYNSIEDLKSAIIEDKVHKLMYRSLKNIINFISSGFKVRFELEDDMYMDVLYWKETRNIIIHNRGIVNDIYLNAIKKHGIKRELQIGNRLEIEISEVIRFAENLKLVANEIYFKITGNEPIELEKDPLDIEEKDDDLPLFRKNSIKIGRNDLCPCNSGLKYKNCCINKDVTTMKN